MPNATTFFLTTTVAITGKDYRQSPIIKDLPVRQYFPMRGGLEVPRLFVAFLKSRALNIDNQICLHVAYK